MELPSTGARRGARGRVPNSYHAQIRAPGTGVQPLEASNTRAISTLAHRVRVGRSPRQCGDSRVRDRAVSDHILSRRQAKKWVGLNRAHWLRSRPGTWVTAWGGSEPGTLVTKQ